MLAGRHTGDLEIQYEQGDLVYASLMGQCAEVDVQLSQEVVSLQPTYVNTQSQRCFRSGFCCLIACAATRYTETRTAACLQTMFVYVVAHNSPMLHLY